METPRIPDLNLQSIIDSHTNPFVLLDENFTIVAANKAYCETYGTSDEKMVGRKCHMVSHYFETPCYMNNEDCPLSTVLDTNDRYEVLHTHFDQFDLPEHVRLKGYPILGADGTRFVGEEIVRLARGADLDCEDQKLIGRSVSFRSCIEGLTSIAESDVNTLLVGESGSGKSLAASYIHSRSPRSGRPFVTVDCTAVNETLFESELFGHERGAFAGCVGRRRGLVDEADGGTLHLDEIGDLPLAQQGRLLDAIETGCYRRVGGREMLRFNVRIISTTRHDLPARIQGNRFRSGLYRRLAGVVHSIPALRERKEDIPALADALLVRLHDAQAFRCHIDEDARQKLEQYDYPGNISELRNTLQRALSQCTDGHIRAEHIRFDGQVRPVIAASPPAVRSLKQIEAEQIALLLEKYHGHRRKAAEELGISERTLYRKLVRYQLNR
jgi:two-component system response regulator AtoC